jgi:hypothetical protein
VVFSCDKLSDNLSYRNSAGESGGGALSEYAVPLNGASVFRPGAQGGLALATATVDETKRVDVTSWSDFYVPPHLDYGLPQQLTR